MQGLCRRTLLRAALIRYYITDRRSAPEPVLDCIRRAIQSGVDRIQIREKDLSACELFALVRRALELCERTPARILVNDRADVAIASGAYGVHLPSHSIAPSALKTLHSLEVGVSCHSVDELRRAEREGADFAVFGPVFVTPPKPADPIGLEGLREGVRAVRLPVLALGGVTLENAAQCVDAGAAGVAGISMFQQLTRT